MPDGFAELSTVYSKAHEFVPLEVQPCAYLNRPLPIGFEKTISQPLMVAVMTDLLERHKVDLYLLGDAGQAHVLAGLRLGQAVLVAGHLWSSGDGVAVGAGRGIAEDLDEARLHFF